MDAINIDNVSPFNQKSNANNKARKRERAKDDTCSDMHMKQKLYEQRFNFNRIESNDI